MSVRKNHVIIHAVTVTMGRNKKPKEDIIGRASKHKVMVIRKLYPKLKYAKNIVKLSILAKDEFFLSSDKKIVSGRHQPGSKLKILAQDFFAAGDNPIVDACNSEIIQELKKFTAGKEYKTYFVFERIPKPEVVKRKKTTEGTMVA